MNRQTGNGRTDARPLRYRRLWAALGLVLVAGVVAISLLNVPSGPGGPGTDKIYHAIVYAALMGWWGMVQPTRRVAWAVGLAGLGLALEGVQSLTGYRTLDRWDAAANMIGVMLALALLRTPLAGLLAWVDRQLADRLDAGAA